MATNSALKSYAQKQILFGKSSGRKITKTITITLLIIGSFISIVPLVWLVRSSFMNIQQMFVFPPEWIPKPWMWKNYPDAMAAAPFVQYFFNTMKLVVSGVLGDLITCTMAGYSFSRLRWKGRDFFFGLLYSTMLLPGLVTLIPVFLLWAKLDFVDTYIPLMVPAWLGAGVFYIFMLRQFFRTIPRDYEDSAKIDGANTLQVMWHIIVPLSKPALITVAIFSFMFYWNFYIGPLIYLNSPEKYTLSIGLATFVSTYGSEWSLLMAASTLMLLPTLIVFLFAQKYFVQGITLSGLKG